MDNNEKLIKAEMLVSRSFIASAQSMFGESYKAIIRNIPVKYGPTIVEHLLENIEIDTTDDRDKLEFLFSAAISADCVGVDINEGNVLLTIKGCNHHRAVEIEEKFGLDRLRVCPVGIIGTCLIEQVLNVHVKGGRKDPSKYEASGICTIKFELFDIE